MDTIDSTTNHKSISKPITASTKYPSDAFQKETVVSNVMLGLELDEVKMTPMTTVLSPQSLELETVMKPL